MTLPLAVAGLFIEPDRTWFEKYFKNYPSAREE
jgi:hypothetical protein